MRLATKFVVKKFRHWLKNLSVKNFFTDGKSVNFADLFFDKVLDLLAHLFLLFFVIDLLELTFKVLFFIEMVLRMYGLGIHGYFRSAFNKYDFSVRNINYTPLFLRLSIHSYAHSFVHSFAGLFVLLSIRSFVHLLIHLFFHLFVYQLLIN